MDVVRLFFNSIDIEPSTILKHFLHFLGFYVEQNMENRSYVGEESILDIYIVSNDFFSHHKDTLNDVNLEKTILILKDKWYSEDEKIKTLYWDESKSNEEFLLEFIKLVFGQIEKSEKARLLKSDIKWKDRVVEIVKVYTENRLLESSLITRCFYKQNEFYSWGIGNYRKFIEAFSGNEVSDYVKYVVIFAKYEADLISKKNSYKYSYDTKELLKECNELLTQYNESEELHLLKADIMCELEDNWVDGGDRYGDVEVSHCAYAFLKWGKIVRNYYAEYDNSINLLKKAIEIFPQYYQAWYQLGVSYEKKKDTASAIDAFKKIYIILEDKFRRQVLAPLEWEYLYKAIMRIAIIYKIRYGDYVMAYEYNDIANTINKKQVIDNYIKYMLVEELDIKDISSKIYEAIREHVNIKLEEIY